MNSSTRLFQRLSHAPPQLGRLALHERGHRAYRPAQSSSAGNGRWHKAMLEAHVANQLARLNGATSAEHARQIWLLAFVYTQASGTRMRISPAGTSSPGFLRSRRWCRPSPTLSPVRPCKLLERPALVVDPDDLRQAFLAKRNRPPASNVEHVISVVPTPA